MNKFLMFFATFLVCCSFQTIFSQNTLNGKKVISSCNGFATYLPNPEYPPIKIEERKYSESIAVQVLINENGNVETAKAISGRSFFREAAEKAALEAKFRTSFKAPTKVPCVITYVLRSENTETSEIEKLNNDKKRAKISQGGVCNGSATYLPQPEYPEEAKAQGIKGTVSVQILIDENGDVESAKAISNLPILKMEAEKAALKAKFKQAFSNGKPTKVGCVLVYFFRLENPKKSVNNNETQNVGNNERPTTCGGGVVNSRAIYFPQPEYPKEAKEKNISGTVIVNVSIDEEGNVTEAKACSGHPLLRPESEKAALKAKFNLTKLSGIAVKVSGILVYNFKSEDVNDLDDEITFGKPINLPKPPFPYCNCKFGGKEVSVGVQIEINKDGNVISAQAIYGHPVLKFGSQAAARNSTFSPTKVYGKAVKAKALLEYTFDTEKWVTKDVSVKSIEPIKETEKTEKALISDDMPLNSKPIFAPQPEYPAAAKLVGVFGEVKVEILIDENGNVEEAKAVSGNPLLRIAAEKAAKLTRYEPPTLSGTPVKVKGFIVYKFN